MREYHINLTKEQRKDMNGGKEIKIQLDDDTVLYLTKTVKRQSLQAMKEYNQSYYLRNKEHIQELRRINRKKRKEAGLTVNYQTKEYAHDYYMRVTKPKRQKQKELKGETE